MIGVQRFGVNVALSCSGSLRVGKARRLISTTSALHLLGLEKEYTPKELRNAYFRVAKQCHPDTTSRDNPVEYFHKVSEAYEFLKAEWREIHGSHAEFSAATYHANSHVDYVSLREEEIFREACQEWLGVDAETVEESKRCPMFRQWLQGNTDAAFHWNVFLCLHGGLAPRLRPPMQLLQSSDGDDNRQSRPTARRSRFRK